ncbi:MAG: bifunctional lysylphosphatidylglycerol flippase/synthetase MprF [Bacteroidota bacterium]
MKAQRIESPRRERKDPRRWLPYVGLILFAGALVLIYGELRGFQYRDVVDYLRSIPTYVVALTVGLTALNFWLLTAYDRLAVAYVRESLPYRRIALASFVGYSFSVALGHAYLTGGAVRYRFYSAWGISGTDIARIIVFCGISFWIGFAALGGVLFATVPFPIPPEIQLPVSLRPLGIALLIVLALYLSISAVWKRPVRIRDWQIEIPSIRLTTAQGLVAVADLMLSAAILYLLLPHSPEVALTQIVGVFLLAMIAGYVSQVPGGLGVFDSVVLILLTPPLEPTQVLGALLAFRGIFYLLPLLTGATVFGVTEAIRYRAQVRAVSRRITATLPRTVPPVLAILAFMTGILLLMSATLPIDTDRVASMVDTIPWQTVELAHLATSLTGILFLFISIGLYRRLAAGFTATMVLFVVAAATALLRGSWEVSIAVAIVFLAFLPARPFFYRRRHLFAQPFGPGFAAALLAVILTMVWLGVFVYQEHELTSIQLLQVSLDADAARFLRSLAAAIALTVVLTAIHMLKPMAPDGIMLDEEIAPRVRNIAASAPRSDAHLALLGDKYLLFDEDRQSFIMYGIRGRTWAAMGEPVAAPDAAEELAWRFHSVVARHGGRIAFYNVSAESAALYLDLGLALFELGEEARVRLATYEASSFSRSEFDGGSLEIIPHAQVPAILSELRNVSDNWLNVHRGREQGFSLGHFAEEYIGQTPVAVVRQNGAIIAFANLWLTDRREEIAADMVRYVEGAPQEIVHFTVSTLMTWARDEGFDWFNLGIAPFDDHKARPVDVLWTRTGGTLYRHAEHFESAADLRRFKESYGPIWRVRYIAAPGAIQLPGVLNDVSSLIAESVDRILPP